jgi:hypothetical protein
MIEIELYEEEVKKKRRHSHQNLRRRWSNHI